MSTIFIIFFLVLAGALFSISAWLRGSIAYFTLWFSIHAGLIGIVVETYLQKGPKDQAFIAAEFYVVVALFLYSIIRIGKVMGRNWKEIPGFKGYVEYLKNEEKYTAYNRLPIVAWWTCLIGIILSATIG